MPQPISYTIISFEHSFIYSLALHFKEIIQIITDTVLLPFSWSFPAYVSLTAYVRGDKYLSTPKMYLHASLYSFSTEIKSTFLEISNPPLTIQDC